MDLIIYQNPELYVKSKIVLNKKMYIRKHFPFELMENTFKSLFYSDDIKDTNVLLQNSTVNRQYCQYEIYVCPKKKNKNISQLFSLKFYHGFQNVPKFQILPKSYFDG